MRVERKSFLFYFIFWRGWKDQWGWVVGNERPGTDHVTSGPMRGLEKMHPMAHTHRKKDMATLWLNRHSEADSVKEKNKKKIPHTGDTESFDRCG